MLVRLSNFSSFQSVHVRLFGRAPHVVVARLYTFLQVDDVWLDEKVARLARMCMVFCIGMELSRVQVWAVAGW